MAEGLSSIVELHPRILVVDDGLAPSAVDSTSGRRLRALLSELRELGYKVVEAVSFSDALANVLSDASIVLIIADWTLGKNTGGTHQQATDLLLKARSRNARLPIFLSLDRKIAHSIPLKVMELTSEFVWLLEDSPRFIAGRANAAVRRYLDGLLPPLADAMVKYASTNEYSWAAPGHQGGVAFTKNAAGRVFFDHLGENLFRSDMGIERGTLGSMLDHTGPMGAAEKYQSYVFGSHRTYSGVNGSSGSNRVILSACVQAGRIALCDRNCHKSIEQGLVVTGGIPVYLVPTRNRYGIIGPIPPSRLTLEAIRSAISGNPLCRGALSQEPVYSVITNCTYDGLCINAKRAEQLLGQVVDRVHFDEAWFAYARFNGLYADRYAMRGSPSEHTEDMPTVFATQSTHKLLAALSQATFIHVRNGRSAIPHAVFNESYQLHTTTSPLYAILASNDIAACMMDHGSGKALTDECVREAVAFRQSLMRAYREISKEGRGWFFHPWNAWEVKDPDTGKLVPFDQAKPDLLATDPRCWTMNPDDAWHGFEGLEEGWCMLDPIKVGIVCPGVASPGNGSQAPPIQAGDAVPAQLVSRYLEERGVVVARTTDSMVLFLFSIGVTKGKWGTLLSALLSFKKDFDHNEPLARALPDLYEQNRARYHAMGLRDLGQEMCTFKAEARQARVLQEAYEALPRPHLTPRESFERLMAGESEAVGLTELEGRTAAVSVVPYPPGIPMVMGGEVVGAPQTAYLQAMQKLDERFPGFEVEIQGVERGEDGFKVRCLLTNLAPRAGEAKAAGGEGEGDRQAGQKRRKG